MADPGFRDDFAGENSRAIELIGIDPDSEVAHAERDGLLRRVDAHDDRAPLTVLDRVADEVADDPANAPRIHVDGRVPARGDEADLAAVLFCSASWRI